MGVEEVAKELRKLREQQQLEIKRLGPLMQKVTHITDVLNFQYKTFRPIG